MKHLSDPSVLDGTVSRLKIAQLTAGTGSWYCGTCLRDNASVLALRDLGHDVTLVPLYLPIATDQVNASEGEPVRMGGVETYLAHHSALFRALPAWATRPLSSRPVLAYAASKSGATDPTTLGAMTVSMLRGPDGPHARHAGTLAAWIAEHVEPDVVILSNALLLGLAPAIREHTGARIVCTLQGEDEYLDALGEPHAAEAWRLTASHAATVDSLFSVSRYHGDLMAERLGLSPDAITIVPNGIHLDGFAPASQAPTTPTLGYLARMCHDKGLHLLVEAWLALRARRPGPLRLTIAGTLVDLDRPFVEGLKARIQAAGLADDVTWHPNVTREEKQRLLREEMTLFSVPAVYRESFGLYLLEAWASGLPVVAPNHAGLAELVSDTGGGLLSAHDDAASLADAIDQLLDDPVGAAALAERGREAVLDRYGATHMAARLNEVLVSVIA